MLVGGSFAERRCYGARRKIRCWTSPTPDRVTLASITASSSWGA